MTSNINCSYKIDSFLGLTLWLLANLNGILLFDRSHIGFPIICIYSRGRCLRWLFSASTRAGHCLFCLLLHFGNGIFCVIVVVRRNCQILEYYLAMATNKLEFQLGRRSRTNIQIRNTAGILLRRRNTQNLAVVLRQRLNLKTLKHNSRRSRHRRI